MHKKIWDLDLGFLFSWLLIAEQLIRLVYQLMIQYLYHYCYRESRGVCQPLGWGNGLGMCGLTSPVTVARVAGGHLLILVDRLQCSVNQAPCGLGSATPLCKPP